MDGVLTKIVAAFGPSEIVAFLKAVTEVQTTIHALVQRQRYSHESRRKHL